MRWPRLIALAACIVVASTGSARAFWAQEPIAAIAADSDALLIVTVHSIIAGVPAPPSGGLTTGEADTRAATAARNLITATVVEVLAGSPGVTAGREVVIDVPWAMFRDVTPLHGPSFRVDDTVALFVQTVVAGETFRLTRDTDGRYVVADELFANAQVSPLAWRPLEELRGVVVRRAPAPSARGSHGCAGCSAPGDPDVTAIVVIALFAASRRRRATG